MPIQCHSRPITQKYAIELAYDGSDFCGWQTQRGTGGHKNTLPAVEDELAAAIHERCDQRVRIVASGRTDAGVHASGQVAHFVLDDVQFSNQNLLRGLNHLLPDSIEIHRLGNVPDAFRAQNANRKQYSYYFLQGPSNIPQLKRYTMRNVRSLDGEAMDTAVKHLIGEHDFQAFSSSGANTSTTVRHIYEAEVTSEPVPQPGLFDPDTHQMWRVRLVGNGFLKQMVRTICGTLKQIGEGQRPPADIKTILESKHREQAGPTAPPNGLWLDRVWYSPQAGINFLHTMAER